MDKVFQPMKIVDFIPNKISETYKIDEMNIEDFLRLRIYANELIKFVTIKNGIGLAAPQVGDYRSIFVYKNSQEKWITCVNPWYTQLSTPLVQVYETCLSYPGKKYEVTRYKRVQAFYYALDEKGNVSKKHVELRGTNSIVYQHEFDHLYGFSLATVGTQKK